MSTVGPPEITPCEPDATDSTTVRFTPDLDKFGLDQIPVEDMLLIRRRVMDLAATVPGVSVRWNGRPVGVDGFKDYVGRCVFPTDAADSSVAHSPVNKPQLCHIKLRDGLEAVLAYAEHACEGMSYVNGIYTPRGGTHVTAVEDVIIKEIVTILQRKHKGM